MIRRYTTMAIFGIATIFLAFSPAQADLTQDILDGIKDGSRTIRPEIKALGEIPVPEPSNLNDFIKDNQAAIELGKALFWDMRMGSDGVQACASCHFNAGADSRVKNQLSPGLAQALQNADPDPDKTFDPSTGANFTLTANNFPLHVKSDPILFNSAVVRDTNDVVSSQGVHFSSVETTGFVPDPDGFQVGGVNVRRVEPRNTPTVINAVFNHRNFWDGRANNIFNGVTPFGANDPHSYVYQVMGSGTLEAVQVRIDNASLASQAVGPPVSSFEMSTDGRTWTEIGDQFIGSRGELPRKKGRRTLGVRPLANQLVHPEDSVLGGLSNDPNPGLTITSYDTMIRRAFKPEWWNSQNFVHIHADGSRSVVPSRIDDNSFSQMEMNFSLFFGLAVQLYEATLVADDSPVDRFLKGRKKALKTAELVGFHLADDEGRCLNCHGQGEFTFAAVSRINNPDFGVTRIRRGDLIDEGFNNIGVRPTLEDLGVGGKDPLDNPFSLARKLQLDPNAGTDAENNAHLGADGAFKIPTLRNVELTAPYFHNGGELTLEDVIDFYFRGGDFRRFEANPDLNDHPHPVIGFDAPRVNESEITGLGILRGPELNSGPGLDDVDKANLVAFLKALTDERVRYAKAPFDHPQLFVPNGHPGDHLSVTDDGTGNATDDLMEIPAVGKNGGDPLPTFADNLASGNGGGNDGGGNGGGKGGGKGGKGGK
jgi:cytochrome c peroxidase